MGNKIYNYDEIGKQIDTIFGIKLLRENVKADYDELEFAIQDCQCLVFNTFNRMRAATKEEFDKEKLKIIDEYTTRKVNEFKLNQIRRRFAVSTYSMDNINEDIKSILNYLGIANDYIVHILMTECEVPTKVDVNKKILQDKLKWMDFDDALDMLYGLSDYTKENIREDMGINVDQLLSWIEKYKD